MKVLLLPYNTASEMSHKLRALRSIGIDARGISIDENLFLSNEGLRVFPNSSYRDLAAWPRNLSLLKYLYDSLKWADVIHWFWDFGVLPKKLDKAMLRRFNMPGVIQWLGSELRNPLLDFEVNPYYKRAFSSEDYEYPRESEKNSKRIQRDFADVGFYPITYVGMGHYIDKDIFPKWFYIPQTSIISDYQPRYPDGLERRPLIVHAPSAPNAKGTRYVLQAIDALSSEFSFEFRLLQNMARSEVMTLMQQCDIYIDQVIIGMHGLASVEAMAFGKPVVCYINEVTGRDYPEDLPIVNASPDNLRERLAPLVANPELRHAIGRKGRAYVEKYHREEQVANELVQVYEEVIWLHKKRAGA